MLMFRALSMVNKDNPMQQATLSFVMWVNNT